ncbi:MAG: phytoene desaturase family protein [Candidatus Nanopelagicales bacterium]
MSSVVVIGAGAAGLATAARLAVKGHNVTVLEQSDRVGGKLATYRRDGFAFDTGPSLFTLPAVYRDLFLKTGKALEDEVDLQPVEPGFGYTFADGAQVVMPGVDPARCARALGDGLGGRSIDEWRTLMDRAARMWRLTRGPFLQAPLQGWKSLLPLAKPADVRTIAPLTSLRKLGESTLSDPRAVTLLDRYATYTGSDPRRAPAVLATVPYVEQEFGVWHLGGGLGTLADALHRRCLDRGVDVRTGVDVTAITTDHSGVTGVLADGNFTRADIVVANADAGLVYRDLLDDPRAKDPSRSIQRSDASLAGFVLLLALRGRTPGLQHHNVWFPADYDAEFDAIFGDDPHPVEDPAIYVCAPDDPAMRPDDDHESWFILVNAPRHDPQHGVDWSNTSLAESYADRILALLAARGPDVRDRIIWREIRTPADLQRQARAPGGSIYGTSSNGARAAFARPANQSPVPGLYLVGGSTHPGGGLPLVGMGAEITAELIGRP